MKDNIVSSHTYTPEFERARLASMLPHARHEEMLEEHRQAKARRREDHRKGLHKMRYPAGVLK
jgi:hypothetical protein